VRWLNFLLCGYFAWMEKKEKYRKFIVLLRIIGIHIVDQKKKDNNMTPWNLADRGDKIVMLDRCSSVQRAPSKSADFYFVFRASAHLRFSGVCEQTPSFLSKYKCCPIPGLHPFKNFERGLFHSVVDTLVAFRFFSKTRLRPPLFSIKKTFSSHPVSSFPHRE